MTRGFMTTSDGMFPSKVDSGAARGGEGGPWGGGLVGVRDGPAARAAGGGAGPAPATRVAELVADDAARDGAEHGARTDRQPIVLACDAPLFVSAALLAPAFL